MRLAIDITGLTLSALGVLIAVWSLVVDGEPPQAVLAIVLALVALLALILAFVLLRIQHRNELTTKRAAAWAAALPKVSEAMLHLANSVVSQDPPDDASGRRDFKEHAERACHALAAAFNQVVGRDCRVTLVETWVPAASPGSRRVDDTAVRRLLSTTPRLGTHGTDWVSENTDFDEIFRGADYFFSNDLAVELSGGYQNSHWTRAKVQEMKRTGNYPYRATIVWPVQAIVELDGAPAAHTVGFLCVDCKESGIFDATIDVNVGGLVARALYAVWPRAALNIDTQTEQVPS